MLSLVKLKIGGQIEALSKQQQLSSVLLRYGAMAGGRMHLTKCWPISPAIDPGKRRTIEANKEDHCQQFSYSAIHLFLLPG